MTSAHKKPALIYALAAEIQVNPLPFLLAPGFELG